MTAVRMLAVTAPEYHPFLVTDAAERREQLKQVYLEASACPRCPLRSAHDRRLRRRQRGRRADVRRRGAGRERGQAGAAVRGPGRQAARRAARGDRAPARRGLHRERAQVPPARQSRPAAARDRGLPRLSGSAGRADRAARHLHPRELLDQAAARRPDRHLAPARPGEVHVIGPRAVRLYPIYHPAAALYTPSMWRRCGPTSRACPSCWRGSPAAARAAWSRCRSSSPRRRRHRRPAGRDRRSSRRRATAPPATDEPTAPPPEPAADQLDLFG